MAKRTTRRAMPENPGRHAPARPAALVAQILLFGAAMHADGDLGGLKDASSAPARHPAVLVVEDDEALRTEVVELLRSDGCHVIEAGDGRRALRLMRSNPSLDVVLLDLWLPDMDGWSFRVQQRKDPALRDVPVVVLSADRSAQARAIDASAFLPKPFDADGLCNTVRRVLAEHRAASRGATELVSHTVSLLTGAVGHEIANPLMALIGALERTREKSGADGPDPRDPEPNIDEMLEHCWRIASSLRTLRGLPCPAWTGDAKVDVHQLARAAIAAATNDGARITFDGAPDAFVRGDPPVVRYLCTALVRNALESVPRWGRGEESTSSDRPDVDVRLHHTAHEVIFDVRDRGANIPENELARIFSVDHPGRERAWGAGLRLWFVRHLVEALGGAIDVSNEANRGVRCRVRLPAARPRTDLRATDA